MLCWIFALRLLWGGILSRFSTAFANVLSPFGLQRIDEKMYMSPVLAALTFYRVIKVDCSSSEGPDKFRVADFAMGFVRAYTTERRVPVNS